MSSDNEPSAFAGILSASAC